MTRYELHVKCWKDGCGSDYCDGARKKTFFRGDSIPCDILFVGEAPGKSEAVAGIPFAPGAPAGRLLTHMIQKAIPSTYRVGFANLVACIPRLEGEEKIEPDPDQIALCKPRLEEIIDICQPKLIFAVGSQSRDALTQGYLHSTKIPKGCTVHHIVHPAWILRQTTAFIGLEVQRVICVIQDAIHDFERALTKPEKKGLKKPISNTQRSNPATIEREVDEPF